MASAPQPQANMVVGQSQSGSVLSGSGGEFGNAPVPCYAANAEGVPTREMVEAPTLQELPDVACETENTQDLSDVSDRSRAAYSASSYGSHGGNLNWLGQYRTFFRSGAVRWLTLANVVILLFTVLMALAYTTMSNLGSALEVEFDTMKAKNYLCYYEWGPWSECSATCRPPNGPPPMKRRRVLPGHLIEPRGIFRTHRLLEQCRNLSNMVVSAGPCSRLCLEDTIPCNVYYCPKPLTAFEFGPCINMGGNKIRVRQIPAEAQLINISQGELTEYCGDS